MKEKNKRRIIRFFKSGLIYSYFLAVLIIGVIAAIFSPLANTQNYHVVSFILLFAVSLLSTFMRVGPVLLASAFAALLWNFFFIPPHLTFHIEKTEDLLIFGLFFIIALANGILTTRVRRQEELMREREKRTNTLFQLTRELSKASGTDEVLKTAIQEINNHFLLNSMFILQDGNNILSSGGRLQKEKKLSEKEYQVAEWVFRTNKRAGAYTGNNNEMELTFYPLPGTKLNPGVVIIKQPGPFSEDQKPYWDTFLVQISNALEREFLGELARKVQFLDESDRLYKTLFNSISHELRIPVATIMGASDSILNSSEQDQVNRLLCQEIFNASVRLNRLIENLLNMSRLESGHISVRLDWYDINDLINKVSEDLNEELKSFDLKIRISEELSLVRVDFGLMEQVLYNLLYNCTQYAPVQSVIELNVFYRNNELIMEIADQGPGFPESELKNVFMKFFRVTGSKTGGLGLGLSIAKGFIEAHNGTIRVENREKGGAKFVISLPYEKPDINIIQQDLYE